MSQGEVRKRAWKYDGKRREAWGFTVVIDGKRIRRSGYGSRAEAQEALDELKHPAPAAPAPPASITLGEAFERYFKAKARKRSLAEDQRIAKHLKAEFGDKTPLAESPRAGSARTKRSRRGPLQGVVLLEVTKSGERREVPLCGPADAILARRAGTQTDGLVFGNRSWDAFRKHWARAVVAAKIDARLTFHDLRHTFASWARREGADLQELQKLLGHATLAMTMRYAHLAPNHLRSAVSRLDNMLKPAGSGTRRAQEAETLIASK